MAVLYKVLSIWTSRTEAQLALGFLESRGFHPHLNGAKEYTSHITGMDSGRYEISVPADEFNEAQAALAEIPSSVVGESSVAKDSDSKIRDKAVYTWILSLLLLPIIGNLISLYYVWKMTSAKHRISRMVLFGLNIVLIVFYIQFLLKSWMNS